MRSTWRLHCCGRAVHTPCLTLLRMGFTQLPQSPAALVRSYRTVSPLPVLPGEPSAVCFLLHFPACHHDWPLASILPCGAPTFLSLGCPKPRPPGRLTVAKCARPAGQTHVPARRETRDEATSIPCDPWGPEWPSFRFRHELDLSYGTVLTGSKTSKPSHLARS